MQQENIITNQILILETDLVLNRRELLEIRADFMKQLSEGVAIVPNGFRCSIVERNQIMIKEEK